MKASDRGRNVKSKKLFGCFDEILSVRFGTNLFEDDKLRSGEDERHEPGEDDHAPSSSLRGGGQARQRATDGQVAVNAHRRQQERRAGQRHDLQHSGNLLLRTSINTQCDRRQTDRVSTYIGTYSVVLAIVFTV